MNFAILLFLTGMGSIQGSSVAEIVDSWESGSDAIQSYKLTVRLDEYSYVRVDPTGRMTILPDRADAKPVVTRTRIMRSGRSRRGDFPYAHDDPGAGSDFSTITFDGEKTVILNPRSRKATVQQGFLAMGNTEYEDYEASYRSILGSIDRIAETRKRDARLLPREGRLFVLDVPFAKSKTDAFFNYCWRVWLDPDRNFMPVRIHTWYDQEGKKQLSAEVETTLAEVAPGVWAPSTSYMKVYSKGEASDPLVGQWTGSNRLSVEGPAAFNIELPQEIFQPEIPSGYTVTDSIRNITYMKGSSDPDSYLAHLAASATEGLGKMAPEDSRPPRMQFAPESWWLKYGRWSAWPAAAVLILLAGVAVRRHYATGRA